MSIAGDWNCVVASPIGKQASVLTLAVDGTAVTGTNNGPGGPVAVYDGTADSDKVVFKNDITSPFKMTLTWEFTVSGDTLTGTVAAGAFGKSPLTGSRVV